MSLLAPLGLATLLLLPIIVAIHMWRVRHRRYELSSTLLWSRVLSETPLRRPRQVPTRFILLALQLAVLACGALALSRPSWVAAGAPRHLVVAVDTSLAMSATDVRPSRLDRAKSAVGALIDRLGRNDTMTLVDAGPAPRVLAATGDHAALRQALDALTQSYGASSLSGDGPLLAGLRTANGSHTQTYLFAPPDAPPAALSALRTDVRGLVVRTVGVRADDRGVAALSVSCTPVGKGQDCEAYARLVNSGRHALTTRITASVDNGRISSAENVTLPANSAVPIQLSLPPDARLVSIKLDGHDALPSDDTAWAAVPLPVHRTVLLVTDDPTTPLAQALADVPNLTLKTMTPDTYNSAPTPNVDLTVLDNTDNTVQPSGNLLVINPSGGWPVSSNGTETAPGVTEVRPNDALLRDVDLSSLVIQSATHVTLPSWATGDIEGDQGPLLLSGVMDGRRVAVMLFDPRTTATANASNLDTLLAFPTLLRNAVQALAPAAPASLPAGQVAPAPVTRNIAWLRPVSGATQSLPSSGDLAALPALRPGVYNYGGAAGGTAASLAVNAAVPGDPASSSAAAVAAAPPAPAVVAPPSIMPWEGWAIVAALALIALGGEWWYYVRHT